MLQEPENSVRVRLNGRLGFEWIFEWEGHKLRWIKESPLSNTLECHVVCTDMEICVAQYLPRNGIKGSYFGVYSVWQNNLALCQLKDPLGLKLAMMTILFTFFDKSDDDKRKKKDNYHLELEFQDLTLETQNIMDQTKLHKLDLETDKMLMKAQQKEDKRTEKQLKRSSAYSSTTTSPALSPIPSPSSSSTYADIAPSTKNTKRSAPLLRSLSYSSRDTRNRTPNKLTSFLTPFTKVSAAPVDPLAQKPVRHHQRALSVGVTDMSAVTTYHRY
ncbi:hypothetical protein BC943DRAFT_315743 [Umbelopsis sp. AD052]|nr:hypothetical protein BC943DRAFT_315743 [Umbelopsis sp. AD052]